MWAVLRTRRYQGTWWHKLLDEILVSALLSFVMTAGIMAAAHLLRWQAIWEESSFEYAFVPTMLLVGIGIGYFIVRGVMRLGFLWDRMRRRRMLWALTHAHLTVVVVVALIGTLLLFLSIPLASLLAGESGDDALAALMTQVTTMLFPSVMIVLVVTGMTLLFVLPPSAIFSYLVARQTTRRLEHLTRAAAALRGGNYTTRVLVTGEDEVAQLQTDFNAMADNLENTLRDLETERDRVAALLQSRRELVASVSHELRTPVATMRGYLDSIRNVTGMLPETAQRDVAVMESELLRLQRLIDDLFALSQAEAGGLALDIRPVDVGEVVRRRVAALAPLAWQRERVDIVAEVALELPSALADADRLDQVLVNLLRNALRHTPPGGIIAAIVSAEADTVCIEVRDTGEGIPPEELPHIWERFYR
ncbi:MAG: HAMP domain-containing protein, partial [Anaerolineae bacterium]|nr:HAMP domain-containing protein [Anaerolineae bacterium]